MRRPRVVCPVSAGCSTQCSHLRPDPLPARGCQRALAHDTGRRRGDRGAGADPARVSRLSFRRKPRRRRARSGGHVLPLRRAWRRDACQRGPIERGRGTVAAVVAVAAPALGAFYFVQRPAGLRLVKTVLTRVAGKRAWLSFGAIEALYSQLRSIYGNRSGLIAAFAIHSAIWLFGALEVLLILIAMGLPASYPEALIIESLLQAIRGAAFAIPGALGAQEGGLIAICAPSSGCQPRQRSRCR